PYTMTDRQLRETELAPPLSETDQTASFQKKILIFGQIYGTYILAGGDDGDLMIIDQHAAHEKIVYEKLLHGIDGKVESQHLLVPVTIQLTRKNAALILDAEEDLSSAGFIIDEFGGETVAVRAVPSGGRRIDDPEEIKSLVMELIEGIRGPAGERRMRVYKTIACRAAIKGNTHLSQEQMERLISQLFHAKPPYTCPHGRPAVIHFTREDLEHLFRRS
ncbi:MAG: DNA mismatch repair protein MutL, partial [Methanocalculus sp.]|nr:DNA mismatch repair protein MutL [Methanocalculus sp.]